LDYSSGGCKTLLGIKCLDPDAAGNVECKIQTAWGPNAKGVSYDGTITDCADDNCCPPAGSDVNTSTMSFGAGKCMDFVSACPSNKGSLLDPPGFYFTHSPTTTWYNGQLIAYYKYSCINPYDAVPALCTSTFK
jgi:hypothetical protein